MPYTRFISCFLFISAVYCYPACESDPPDFAALRAISSSRLTVDRNYLRDAQKRFVRLNGVNAAGSSKLPLDPTIPSYVGRPFPLDSAHMHFAQIKALGFNAIRLLWVWEAVEPLKKGEYDYEYLDYFEELIKIAGQHQIYVLINMHDNLFSRHLFNRYNENIVDFYHSYCRSSDTGVADFERPCRENTECGQEELCTKPQKKERSVLVDSLLAIFPRFEKNGEKAPGDKALPDDFYSDRVQGDGAPLWAVRACLPDKDLAAQAFGTFKSLGRLAQHPETVRELFNMLEEDSGPSVDIDSLLAALAEANEAGVLPTTISEGTDLMPWTNWQINAGLSSDSHRCYVSMFAGDRLFPDLRYEMPEDGRLVSIDEYFQDSLTNCWVEIAKRAANYDNVIGYDLLNEPPSAFFTMMIIAALFEGDHASATAILESLAGAGQGKIIADLALTLEILPPVPPLPKKPSKPEKPIQLYDESDEDFAKRELTYQQSMAKYDDVLLPEYEGRLKDWRSQRDRIQQEWGYKGADFGAMARLLVGFDKNYLLPVYERIGPAVQGVDPQAIIWIVETAGANIVLGDPEPNGIFEFNMTRPRGVDQVAFAPHWYPDIYPMPGFNVGPRDFTLSEWAHRDWIAPIRSRAGRATYSLGNIPVVFGEFGTPFNFNGIDWAIENNFVISQQILSNFYEAFDTLDHGRILWSYDAYADKHRGELWNHEDFSIIDHQGKPRGRLGYDRPFARALSGKLVHTSFNSDYHYYDPPKGEIEERRTFVLEMESRETDAPTEIHVPRVQYPDGFYVWLSDGYALYDDPDQTLYYFPVVDAPEQIHQLIIRPELSEENEQRPNADWRYFFDGNRVVERAR